MPTGEGAGAPRGAPTRHGASDPPPGHAMGAGFDRAGVAPVQPSEHGDFLDAWLAASHHGTMAYMARPDAVARRKDPALTLPGARSALVVAHDHFQPDPAGVPDDPSRGVIARYARGRDYHRVMTKGLKQVARELEAACGEAGLAPRNGGSVWTRRRSSSGNWPSAPGSGGRGGTPC
jgi:epoxyqueuosine reductase QueG